MFVYSIIKFMKKIWWLFALVVLYAFFAAMNWLPTSLSPFGGITTLDMENTPTVVEEIRDIGELITAEYYGEVYADVSEVYLSLISKYGDKYDDVPDSIRMKFPKLQEYIIYYAASKKRLNTLTASKNAFTEYNASFKAIADKYFQDKETYKDDYVQLQKARSTFLAAQSRLSILNRKVKENGQALAAEQYKFDRYKKKRQLVYIGRGWVKAGFNFADIADNELHITSKKDTLHIVLPLPKVLNADINPWFIKDEVEGFEVFEETGSDFTEGEAKYVKNLCISKLISEAKAKGLMQKAQTSGYETLSNFFNLLGAKAVTVEFAKNNKK